MGMSLKWVRTNICIDTCGIRSLKIKLSVLIAKYNEC